MKKLSLCKATATGKGNPRKRMAHAALLAPAVLMCAALVRPVVWACNDLIAQEYDDPSYWSAGATYSNGNMVACWWDRPADQCAGPTTGWSCDEVTNGGQLVDDPIHEVGVPYDDNAVWVCTHASPPMYTNYAPHLVSDQCQLTT